jgi:hypothetical protein
MGLRELVYFLADNFSKKKTGLESAIINIIYLK